MRSVGEELDDRVAGIRQGLAEAEPYLPRLVVNQAKEDLHEVVEKLELGVDHAVAALIGGTGSGKSSLFNAISRQTIADVGVIRPTTALATACSWSSEADRLLDFLQVHPERRATRVPPLTPADEDGLGGLVLLDLPDHDSVELTHAEQVDRLLPMIDLLIWVLDPQKYADNALHERYLRVLTQRHEAMLVVVNQVDTVLETSLDNIRNDVARLLAEDDLADVPIVLASARSGSGVGMIRDHLIDVMSNESIAARTARSEIDAIAGRIGQHLAPATPTIPDSEPYVAQLARAAGVDAMTDSISYAVANPVNVALARVQPPAKSSVASIREDWLEAATVDMPAPWRDAVAQEVADDHTFYDAVLETAQGLEVPSGRDETAAKMRWASFGLGIFGIIMAIVTGVQWVSDIGWILAAGGVFGGVGLFIGAAFHRKKEAARRATDYQNRAHDALTSVLETECALPATPLITLHSQVLDWITTGLQGNKTPVS